MTLVRCKVEDVMLESDDQKKLYIESVQVTCSSCGNIASSYGRSIRSVRRCFALMRETCPKADEGTFFYDEG